MWMTRELLDGDSTTMQIMADGAKESEPIDWWQIVD